MDNQAIHVMTIANSIIGVSIIAMPYCFKQCGIILSMVILIVSSVISRLSCHLLLKSAIMSRRRTFEFLAFHAFGPLGKFIVEVGLIGFLLGTCIAFFVVMGDLGPAIVAKMTGTRATDTLRTSILMALALFCVLPLGLLRNIDSLSSVCTATIGFYFCLVLKIIVQSIPHIFSGDWMDKVELWRPAGFLQCLPIFSMALFCQTQIFEIYQAIPNASLEKMNGLIRLAVNICTGVYIFVGVFGYIAFSGQTFTGNILMSFPSSLLSEVIKIGFVLSVAFSFPLIIFPCRASLYSLIYKRTYSLHEGTDKYIPEGRFKGLTFMIVFVSLVTGVMIPNIELVLGLVGSTIGIMVCVLFPAMCFICVSTKNTNERILAQLMLFIGVIVMVLGTYANLYAMEEMTTNPITEKVLVREPEILKLVQDDPALKVIDIPNTTKAPLEWKPEKNEAPIQEAIKEVRHEPPQPEEPAEIPAAPEIKPPLKAEADVQKSADDQQENQIGKGPDNNKPKDPNLEKAVGHSEDNATNKKSAENPVQQQPVNVEVRESNQLLGVMKHPQIVEVPIDKKLSGDLETGKTIADIIKNVPLDSPSKVLDVKPLPVEYANSEKIPKNEAKGQEVENKSNGKKVEEVAKEAIEKEEKELLEQEKEKIQEEEKKNLDLIKSLEEHNKEQKKIVEEKKKILEEIKLRQQALEQNKQQKEIDKVKEEKLKAVEQIEQIAKKAIEKLSGADEQNIVEKVHQQDDADKLPKNNQINLKEHEQLQEVDLFSKKAKEELGDANKQIDMKNPHQQDNHDKQLKDVKNVQQLEVDSKMQKKINLKDENSHKNLNQLNSNINLNNNINPKIDLDVKLKEADVKIGLTKENLVPLPIALSNNFSEMYKNMVVAKQDASIVNIPDLPKVMDKKIHSKNIKVETVDIKINPETTKVEPKQGNEKQIDTKKQEADIQNKERDQINLFDVLRTKAEKGTILNPDKQENIILHREIRSLDNKEVKNLPLNIENQQFDEKQKNPEIGKVEKGESKAVTNKSNKENVGASVFEKSEDSCDKNDKNVDATKDEKIGSTETPLIRMITKLSEPELVSLKLPIVDNLEVDSILKPFKRDLKSYKSRRRK